MSDTFVASVRSVGTAVTLASVGVYLHQRGFVVGDGKRTLALLSQQVTFPLFLFTKIVYCNQDWSREVSYMFVFIVCAGCKFVLYILWAVLLETQSVIFFVFWSHSPSHGRSHSFIHLNIHRLVPI
jgi:predicted permease